MAGAVVREHAVQHLQENSVQHNKGVDSFVANTAKTAANFISGYATMPACSGHEDDTDVVQP